ncbi:MAG: DUF2127 domain-containing protein [Candidatus Nomurabacteria bacterium]|nr:DUF2127 domain-containing protein [Candidatus Nomurabacteria bacterium]
MLDKETKEKDIFYIFEGSVILKGIHAVIEIVSGFLVLFITQNFIIQTVLKITDSELGEDPKDLISNYLVHASQNFSISSKHFVAFYLLSHGIIKGILVYNLLKKKLWAYPASIAVFGIFMIYQIIRYMFTHSIWLIVFTIFDAVVIWLVWHEYKIQKIKVVERKT